MTGPTIALLGSCVSRDAFNGGLNPGWRERFRLGPAHYQASLISLLGRPEPPPAGGLADLDPHARACVLAEFSRGFLAEVAEARPDHLLVDLFTDARFGVLRTAGGWVTDNSWKIGASGAYADLADADRLALDRTPDAFLDLWDEACDHLARFLAEHSPGTTILVNRARGAECRLGPRGITRVDPAGVRALNARWDLLERRLLRRFPGARVLDPMAGGICAADAHPWGRYWVHYEPAYYRRLDRLLRRATGQECPDRPGLDQLGLDLGLDQASSQHDHLRRYEEQVAALDGDLRSVAIVSAKMPVHTGLAFARRYPSADVQVLSLTDVDGTDLLPDLLSNLRVHRVRGLGQMHAVLARLPVLDLLIDDGEHGRAQQRSFLRELLYHLRDGGVYAIEDLHALRLPSFRDDGGESVLDLLLRLTVGAGHPAVPEAESEADRTLAASIGELRVSPRLGLVRKRGTHWLRVTEDDDLGRVLGERAAGWCSERVVERGYDYEVPITPTSNRDDLGRDRFIRRYRQPDRRVREYEGVLVAPRGIVARDGVCLPETFRLYRNRVPGHAELPNAGRRFVVAPDLAERRLPTLPGAYFHLDVEWPEGYGHLLTDLLGRLWCWPEVVADHPDIRVLVSTRPDGAPVPPWYVDVLAAAGIEPWRLTPLRAPARVERLVAATPLFSNTEVAHPRLGELWRSTTAALCRAAGEADTPSRIFASRRGRSRRTCHNAARLEARFEDAGYTVVYPEDHPVADQARLFARADAVAGYGGSGLINTIHCRDGVPRIVIAPEGFTAMNEYLIATVQRAPVHYFWTPADVPLGPAWSFRAFMSDFTFDFERDGPMLDRLLDG